MSTKDLIEIIVDGVLDDYSETDLNECESRERAFIDIAKRSIRAFIDNERMIAGGYE